MMYRKNIRRWWSVLAMVSVVVTAPQLSSASETIEGYATAVEAEDSNAGVLVRLLRLLGLSQSAAAAVPPLAEEGTATDIRAVALFKPKNADFKTARQFFGRVVAKDTAQLGFERSGTLNRFPVEEGQIVQPGTLLAQLELAEFKRAVERAEINLTQSQRNYKRAKTLVARNAVAETRLEDAETAFNLARVALRDAQDALEDATIVAPYRAMISERLTANHVIVAPGTPIVELHDISSLRAEIEVPERLFQAQRDVAALNFTATWAGQTRPLALELAEFEARTGSVGQTFTVSLKLPDTAFETLLPGNSLTVHATMPSETDAVVLPPTAVSADAHRQPFVMQFEELSGDIGRVHSVPVEVDTHNGVTFLVSGLPVNAEIVRIGAHLLRDGQKVRRYTGLMVEE
ncbi:efflux RND transporter periplasmic adaptor subunit [Labrenzia sp. R4_1]|uniref:efflux RND transporter periplasmic adaptor subunit n=1 Tax=Labrenzia sp. R4_1 TaxID=2821106 RepID=UPI001ADD3E58|nr:efflux RND transporter periplasmic adaptor subunit [Labrenzia sp. R4_1]MBO9427032.1 efflux RND transporter periplasmic adaptor subunit [Labrenzia sp. R4_1]